MISTGLLEPLPRSTAAHTWFLVLQDRFTKWIELRPLKKATGEAVTEAVRIQICLRHGCPDVIVTDNGRQFTSNEFREFLSALQIEHRPSDPRSWEMAAPTTLPCGSTHNQARRVGVSPLPRFDFTLSSVEPRSKIMFLSTSCQSGAKQTTNLKSLNISLKILPFFLWYF